MNTDDLIKILQASIAPAVLISGVGLLLLSMTNRLTRPIERIRELCADIKKHKSENNTELYRQIDILYLRCRHLRIAIALATVSIICVSLIILALFMMFILQLDLIVPVRIIFTVGIFALILSLFFFLQDISLALRSVKIEIETTKTAANSS